MLLLLSLPLLLAPLTSADAEMDNGVPGRKSSYFIPGLNCGIGAAISFAREPPFDRASYAGPGCVMVKAARAVETGNPQTTGSGGGGGGGGDEVQRPISRDTKDNCVITLQYI